MRKDLIVKTRSLAGSSDLTLLAPIKRGLVPALESVTYKTRVKRLLQTLNSGRSSSHEYVLLRPFSDAVERVGKIHSVRVVVLEPEDKVLLAVTFDGAWESYIRVLWQKVGALLDVIFCNTEDYVSAFDNSFDKWAEWARRVQRETEFFYGMPSLTVDDAQYLKTEAVLHRALPPTGGTDLQATAQVVTSPEAIAWRALSSSELATVETFKQGLQSLAVLYRLTDLYIPGGVDGKYLRRAARDLLLEFDILVEFSGDVGDLIKAAKARFEKQLAWFVAEPESRTVPTLPSVAPVYAKDQVQGGILSTYDNVTHGCMLMIAFDNGNAAIAFLDDLIPQIATEASQRERGSWIVNAAVTFEGLRTLGLTEAQLAYFPQEFREGMQARASVLGDLRANHPRRWRLPLRNWPRESGAEPKFIDLNAVHLVVNLRIESERLDIVDISHADHPLRPWVDERFPTTPEAKPKFDGVNLLSVQSLRRYKNKDNKVEEHFGFVDGEGQPVIDPKDPNIGTGNYSNQVQLGELLLGYANQADNPPEQEKYSNDAEVAVAKDRLEWLRNGTFLVVRKLAQNVGRLNKVVDEAMVAASAAKIGIDKEDIFAKMMGRSRNGVPLASPGGSGGNNFDYTADPDGSKCPFQAHIRRVNPRESKPGFHEPLGGRTPRIMRRSMSYGPRYNVDDDADPGNSKERGLVFMAYNASIGEQFEVMQRWISGGNSTGISSAQNDPFLGVAENGQRRFFRFGHNGQVVHMALDGTDTPLGDPEPFVRLEWGAYLFTPSIPALRKLRDAAVGASAKPAVAWSADEGLALIASLKKLEQDRGPESATIAWKSALEDPGAQDRFISASVWAAIREHHGGVLRTPYGVLVADRKLVMDVFNDVQENYTVSGYHERMMLSIGEIYLGLDRSPGVAYEEQSKATNAAIQAISSEDAFQLACKHTNEVLQYFIAAAKQMPNPSDPSRWELNLDVREVTDKVLAIICQYWFGLPAKEGAIVPGSSRWDWDPKKEPLYPGNFTAPSRYLFQPRPGPVVEQFGILYGKTMTAAFQAFLEQYRNDTTVPKDPENKEAPIASAILKAFPGRAFDAQVARTFVGALMGFLPTVDGNLRRSLNEWLKDGTFWSLRTTLANRLLNNYAAAEAALAVPLAQAMQLRPSPELVWRTVARHHAIGNGKVIVPVEPGEKIVVSIVSATQQCLAEPSASQCRHGGRADLSPIFGGVRGAPGLSPTHACPGYAAGMGVLLGILTALVKVDVAMRPSPAPLAFTFDGPV